MRLLVLLAILVLTATPLAGVGEASRSRILDMDEHGRITNSTPLEETLQEIRGSSGAVLVVFVHGWKHDSSPGDSNVCCFRALVEALAQAENAEHGSNARRYLGLFIGWPAKVTEVPGIEEFTFWNRKAVADRVSRSGELTWALAALGSLYAEKNKVAPGSMRLIIIGHSFGARLVYESVYGSLISSVMSDESPVSFQPENKVFNVVRGFGDLVVLVNPAFEATMYRAIDRFRQTKEVFPENQQLLLLTVSSETDRATRTWFPIGMKLAGATQPDEFTTIANFEEYVTHEARPCAGLAPAARELPVSALTPGCPAGCPDLNATTIHVYPSPSGFRCIGPVELPWRAGMGRGTPFAVVTAKREVLDGHNGLFAPTFTEFLLHLVRERDAARPRPDP